jgi:sterol desaturase/sphingolipid hydroxylase (fatty acid hydroxylase superfamily)
MDHRITFLGLDLNLVLVLAAATAIALELLLLRHLRRDVDYRDVRRSMAFGLSWAAIRVFGGKVLLFGVWLWAWEHIAPWHVDLANPLSWVAYWLIGDFLYYWTHRAEHRVRLLWSSHLVHHSSEQYNLATAVRQPWTEVLYKPVIALWAPLLGFHPVMYVVVGIVSLMAGQWQHLAWFPKVRRLDAIVMSPSNHRVHHAKNPRYIDRNFGGSLVLWDKLFGTYQVEDEAPRYGVLHLPPAGSALAASLGGWPELATDVRAAGSVRHGVRIALGPPTG